MIKKRKVNIVENKEPMMNERSQTKRRDGRREEEKHQSREQPRKHQHQSPIYRIISERE